MHIIQNSTFETDRFSIEKKRKGILVQRPADWAEACLDGSLADFLQSWNPFPRLLKTNVYYMKYVIEISLYAVS